MVEHSWRQVPKLIALAAIVLTSLNLRTAIVALSPLAPRIQDELGVGQSLIGVLGMIPTAMFAVSAFLLPALMRRLTIAQLLLAAMILTAAGQVWRVLGPSAFNLVAGSVCALFAIGVTNAAMPVAVRSYFPNRVPSVSTTFLVASQVAMGVAPLLAEPFALAAESVGLTGWRASLGSWSLLAVVAAVAWVPLLTRRRKPEKTVRVPGSVEKHKGVSVWRTSAGVGLAFMFGCTSFVTYSIMAFLPQLFVEAGASTQFAGAMLAYWSLLGLPLNVLGPWLVGRFTKVYPMAAASCVIFIVGNIGLATAPMAAPWLWVTLSGLGPLVFPMALTLLNVRTRSMAGAASLSSFAQGFGYTVACAGPLLTGVLREATGSWASAVAVWVAATAVVLAGSYFATRDVFVEDQLKTQGIDS